MSKINLCDIDFDVDYDEILLLESALRHEIKYYGIVEFIDKYTLKVESGDYSYDTYKENLVIAVIHEMCNKAGIAAPKFKAKRLQKYVMGYNKFCIIEYTSKKKKLIRQSYKEAHACFKERGYLFKREDEKYNGTFDRRTLLIPEEHK